MHGVVVYCNVVADQRGRFKWKSDYISVVAMVVVVAAAVVAEEDGEIEIEIEDH